MQKELNHFDPKTGKAKMVDVSGKAITSRRAIARSLVKISPEVAEKLAKGEVTKGDAFATAKIAGILAAKQTGTLIPMCHPLGLDVVNVELELVQAKGLVRIEAESATTAKTGVEMEAMVAASIAALTLYDMIKGYDKSARILQTGLFSKEGGKSGTFQNPQMSWEILEKSVEKT